MGKFVVQFLSMYKHSKTAQLVELTKQIEEAFHVKLNAIDTDAVALNQQVTVSKAVDEIIELLNQMEDQLRASIANSQYQQVRVGIRLGEFLAQLLTESTTLQKIEEDEDRNLESLENQLVVALTAAATCKDRLR